MALPLPKSRAEEQLTQRYRDISEWAALSGWIRGGHQGIVSTRLWRFPTITTKDSEVSGKHKRSIQKSGPGPLHEHEAWGQIQASGVGTVF